MPAASKQKLPPLKSLQTKLRGLQTSFNNMYRFMQQYRVDTKAVEVNVRLEQLDRLWDKMNEAIDDVESHDEAPDDTEGFVKDRIDFENRFYELKSFLVDKIKEECDTSALNQTTRSLDNNPPGSTHHVRLPQITLPKFSGKIDEWLTFRVLYTSLIHWQADLPEVEKFHYLRSQLEGEALAIIDSLPLTKANYAVAWELLTKRYSNTKVLRKRQVQALFELPVAKRECAADLHSLLDAFERIVKTLDQVTPQQADYKDMLLLHLLCSRLDNTTRRSWEEFSSTKESDTVKDLTDFLQRRIRILESMPNKPAEQKIDPTPSKYPKKALTVKAFNATVQQPSTSGKCVACSDSHLLYQCQSFQKMSVSERDALLRSNSLCRNCFRRGHHARECNSKFTCRQCKAKHHTLVCFKGKLTESKPNNNTDPKPTVTSEESTDSRVVNLATTTTVSCNTTTTSSTGVLLLTAIVVLEDGQGHKVRARALLDSSAECNLISKRVRRLLTVKEESSMVDVIGIQGLATRVHGKITVLVHSRVTDFKQPMEMLVLPKIAAQMCTASIDASKWNIPSGIELADPNILQDETVDLVLGAESFFEFFSSDRRIRLGENLPSLVDSVFGWVVTGRYSVDGPIKSVLCDVALTSRLDDMLEKFWECEEVDLGSNYSPEEARCEDYFIQTTQRESSGRYIVSYPKDDEMVARLGESRVTAERRFLQLERRLARDTGLREQYILFMQEYETLGHMKLVSQEEGKDVARCFLPHHPVVKNESTTTKVRVVFDASAKTTSGISLNDSLCVGPVIQEDLRSIILRCRTRQVMLVADIEKMFRQVVICPQDRHLQSILWRTSPDALLSTYELSTITYGTKPAPFLATRTLVQLAKDEAVRFPLASVAIQEDFYMDDAITGTDDPDTARELRIQLQEMLNCGGFRLRKFASNCKTVLEGLAEKELSIQAADGISLDTDPMVKALGLIWMPHMDVFRFKFQTTPLVPDDQLTKRKVLLIIATLFDPLGLIGAVITRAKIFMQLLWRLEDEKGAQLSWDSPLPTNVSDEWIRFHQQIPLLNNLYIERLVMLEKPKSTQIHIFSDASEKAYGACAYVRTEDSLGRIKVALLSSKSRVSPLKTQSIPRLELCGALLAAELYSKVRKSIRCPADVFFWTDSSTVLRWLLASPSTWTTFVANRVSKIQSLTENCQWNHVPGEHNPADLISRGISPEDILDNHLWWKGSSWLSTSSENWPRQQVWSSEGVEEERKRIVLETTTVNTSFIDWYILRFSNYTAMVRRTAYWLRFLSNLRITEKERRQFGPLTTTELQKAEFRILQKVQAESFSSELKALTNGESMPRSSPLRWYNPFIAPNGILRVGGRLGQSRESEDTKHPIVLPARNMLTKLLMRHYHAKLMHAGPQLMLSTIRLRYWPLGGRNVAKAVCHQCMRCYRMKPKAIQQFMAELPAPRVAAARPFSTTGVDYFGPVYVRPGYRRTAVKAYVAVFVCFSTKATHLELVTDLSTARFIQALRRFISRRGKCANLWSDNGTNFVGARNQMKELLQNLKNKEHHDAVAKECADVGMQWNFIPPGAPHFGGLWEAAVRSAKTHLLKVLGDSTASYEDMATLLTQVECCLNSRPLTQLSDDPNDLQPLTPGHFLVGTAMQAVPSADYTQTAIGRLNLWETVQRRLQDFWKRWRTEYLVQLQGRTKWWKPPVGVKEGSLVVIRDDNLPPTRWRMARIIETHPGPDGVVRVVSLRTTNGKVERPVDKICILPVATSTEEGETDRDD
ncbi:uncharacterized protein LOC131676067 [Topomyia yanbarensis]|uniref:uncharacterized protein LOC131676067 n=1 Tax=Topomyia yanbarensis TaxID=2498891 RepID=UPI00273CBB41|nr:uncharacterized protein LOC131676067 [Topomyia yanbarensis]